MTSLTQTEQNSLYDNPNTGRGCRILVMTEDNKKKKPIKLHCIIVHGLLAYTSNEMCSYTKQPLSHGHNNVHTIETALLQQ